MSQWSAIALTCRGVDDLAAAYHNELRLWQEKGVVSKTAEVVVVEDAGPELGSGGATLNALLVIAEQLSVSRGFSVLVADVIRDAKILIIHVGRLYHNEPCGSAAFISLPNSIGYVTASQCRVPLTPLLQTYSMVTQLAEQSQKSDGLWVCGADSTLILQRSIDWHHKSIDDQSDILLFSIPVDAQYAAGKHGVYRLDQKNCPQEIVYQGSLDQVITCHLPGCDKVALVLALVYLKPLVVESLLHLQNRNPLNRCTYLGVDSGALSLRLSFFFDFLAATFSKNTESDFIAGNVGASPYHRAVEQSTVPIQVDVVTDARRLIWQSLHNFKTRVKLLPHLFYHYFIDDQSDLSKFQSTIGSVLQQCGYASCPKELDSGNQTPQQATFTGNVSLALRNKRRADFMGHLRIIDYVMQNNLHESLLPIFYNSCIDGFANELLSHLDQVAITCGSVSVVGRVLSCIADVLGYLAKGQGGLRSGPAQNAEWLDALQSLEANKLELGIQRLAELRSQWSTRSDRLIRAARHYEAAAQIFVRRVVMESVKKYIVLPIGGVESRRSDRGHWSNVWHRAVAAARIDVAGGWSDTPPITYENGGAVLNIAIKIDGKKPIGAQCRRINDPVIRVNMLHYGAIEGQLMIRTLDEIRCYKNPGAPGALVCAALVCTGVVNLDDSSTSSRSLQEQLLDTWASGFEITCWSDLPHGSGLGASSILAGCILMAIWRAVEFQPSVESILNAVLYVEQLLTTGGGWQDQIGGFCPGVKIGRFESDRSWQHDCDRPRLTFDQVRLDGDQQKWWNQHLLLVYTGKTRLAKNLLQEVVRSWYARKPDIVDTVTALVDNAEKAKLAFDSGDWTSVASCAKEYWSQKKFMVGGGGEPERVTRLLDKLYGRQLINAGWLAGAGGGGFLYLITSSASCKAAIETILLEDTEIGQEMNVHVVEIDNDPFIVDCTDN